MLTKESFNKLALDFYHWCNYPAVKYKILFQLLDTPYCDHKLTALRKQFIESDIVNQLYDTQSPEGNWGPLRSKDYSCKSVFPTTLVALDRCLYKD